MIKTRRAGTLAAGVSLILIGALFLASQFTTALDYKTVITFWPAIFILLGADILLFHISKRNEQVRYDGWAIALIFIMLLFAFALAFASELLRNNLSLPAPFLR